MSSEAQPETGLPKAAESTNSDGGARKVPRRPPPASEVVFNGTIFDTISDVMAGLSARPAATAEEAVAPRTPEKSHFGKMGWEQVEQVDDERLSKYPDDAYQKLFREVGAPMTCNPCRSRVVKGVNYINGAPIQQKPGTVRFVCISDTHGRHRKVKNLPPADVLLHAGDITNTGELYQLEDFSDWLKSLTQYKHKVVIAGNHDITLHEEYYANPRIQKKFHYNKPFESSKCRAAIADGCCTFLEDSACEVEGIMVYGSPWQPFFYNWAYNLHRGQDCRLAWEKIPKNKIDVLLTHGPPIGFGGASA